MPMPTTSRIWSGKLRKLLLAKGFEEQSPAPSFENMMRSRMHRHMCGASLSDCRDHLQIGCGETPADAEKRARLCQADEPEVLLAALQSIAAAAKAGGLTSYHLWVCGPAKSGQQCWSVTIPLITLVP
jgi:hypothetical protein